MRHKKTHYAWLFVAMAIMLISCSTVPVTGRRQLNIVPESQMRSMSVSAYQEFLDENELSTDADKTAMVKQVGQRIQHAVEKYCAQEGIDLDGYEWEFNLIESDQVNAWAMPGGKVVVYTGLLPIAQDDTGLAVVMGHEIAHAIARHGNERMSQGLIVEMGGMALSTALSKKPAATRDLFMKSYGTGAQLGVILPFSRKHELEADHMGLIFMAMAGYDPRQAVGFWERMAAEKHGEAPPEFLSTHPADERRIAQIRSLLPDVMPYYQKSQTAH